MNHLVFVVLDSTRYDQLKAAKTRWIKKLGKIEKRFSYASWTLPSHMVYAMGLLPHSSPKRIFASQAYEKDLMQWKERLNLKSLRFADFLPSLSLPRMLKRLGYGAHAFVSLPALNPSSPLAASGFDTYELMPRHNDFASMIERLDFNTGGPQFYFLNVGETHYPYMLPGEKASDFPHLHGLHGVLKNLDGRAARAGERESPFFTPKQMKTMKAKQIKCIEYVDTQIKRLYEKCPENTWIIITSDHGELFGEQGYFGHGPIMHPKVFEVPLVEGMRPS